MSPPQREELACLHCDLVIALAELQPGERATCPRCGFLLTSHAEDGLTRSTAWAIASAVLLVMALCFPFLELKASGLESVMTLPRAAVELYEYGYSEMAVLVLGFIVGVPALMIVTLLALLVPLRRSRAVPWLVPAGRLLFRLGPWNMAEVFVVGVVVSLVKIGAIATVVIGLSFWSYVAFSLCFTFAMSNLDRLEVWKRIEECRA